MIAVKEGKMGASTICMKQINDSKLSHITKNNDLRYLLSITDSLLPRIAVHFLNILSLIGFVFFQTWK